jgi:hypothetical protein
MSPGGVGWRTFVLAWVGLSTAATAALAVGIWWTWALTSDPEPSSADPGLVEGAVAAPVGAAWIVGLGQIVIVPVAVVVGVVAALRFSSRRRVGGPAPPRAGSR